ncbi:MAG: ornithine cyclodeaminase family protein [Rhizobiaceae bacterium]|jgi:ornithine cyclodeaminase|nr:ornithine cyclodeaminase family protein [Rhizobiaceae bacterium]
MPLPVIDAAACRAALPFPALIDALRNAFASSHEAPDRHIHDMHVPGEAEATALLMPAWIEGEVYGVKLANVFPSNAKLGLPSINAIYVLFSARTGQPIAIMDGTEVTARRTVAASALAASYLARADAGHLLVVGTGRLAGLIAEAHAAIRPIRRVTIWGRDGGKAQAVARTVAAAAPQFIVTATDDLQAACATADIISGVTLSTAPLIRGAWLRSGVHVDLIGAFKPAMRETDAEAVLRATVFIDTLGGAKAEAGDLLCAELEGAFQWTDVRADFAALCSGRHPGRTDDDEITLFKSVGAAVEDLAAAKLVAKAVGAEG